MNNSNYSIEAFKKSDIPASIKICDQELGEGYLSSEMLVQLAESKNTFIQSALDSHNNLIGFGFCTVVNPTQLKKSLHSSQYQRIPKEIQEIEQLGIINTLAVCSEFKGMGIGTTLCKQFISFFQKEQISTCISFAWKNKSGINMGGIYEKSGFSALQLLENYWQEESIEHQFTCAGCDAPPCTCDAVLYYRTNLLEIV